MNQRSKLADTSSALAASPIPQVAVKTTKPPGLKGPSGLSPKTNYSRVNTGAPPIPDAGASAQKSMAPMGATMLPAKVASEGLMATMMATPSLNDMVKAALAGAQSRVKLAEEATRQQTLLGEKIAEEKCEECKKDPCSCKTASAGSISTPYAEKLAEAIEWALPMIKAAADVGPGTGPGALTVMKATADGQLTEHMGKAHAQPPMNPGTGKGPSSGDPGNQMANDAGHPAGGSARMIQKNVGKTASVLSKIAEDKDLEKKETEGMSEAKKGLDKAQEAHAKEDEKKEASSEQPSLVDYMLGITKKAEDAINPAKISAGAAVPPETSAAGESGGAPAGGMPQGPRSLVHSNESAINYNKNQAKAPVKSDMHKYVDEPALSGATDSALAVAFSHHSAKDNNKFASAEGATKTAAARALLAKLAEAAQEKVSKG